jgi:hypothetical protein
MLGISGYNIQELESKLIYENEALPPTEHYC